MPTAGSIGLKSPNLAEAECRCVVGHFSVCIFQSLWQIPFGFSKPVVSATPWGWEQIVKTVL